MVFDSDRLSANVFEVANGTVSPRGEGDTVMNAIDEDESNVIISNFRREIDRNISSTFRVELIEMPSNLA